DYGAGRTCACPRFRWEPHTGSRHLNRSMLALRHGTARLSVIQGLAPEDARPALVGEFFRQQRATIDQQGQQAIISGMCAQRMRWVVWCAICLWRNARTMSENANATAQALWCAVNPAL